MTCRADCLTALVVGSEASEHSFRGADRFRQAFVELIEDMIDAAMKDLNRE
jgi:hypothetical protein